MDDGMDRRRWEPIGTQLFERPNNSAQGTPRKPCRPAAAQPGIASRPHEAGTLSWRASVMRLTRPRPITTIIQQASHLHIEGLWTMITADLVKKISLFTPVPVSELESIAARAADVRL